ncbi:MAG: serine/threonine protein kinase [Deltaproteobacteria bacterium]|nr:serine/threonine protein kinase [Deltaproteobacteria bacterium]
MSKTHDGKSAHTGGRRVGKYEFIDCVAEGGMASVWRGVMHGAAGFCRPVAIKRIKPDLLKSPEFVAMFVEEARVGSQLFHANIAQVYDFEQDEHGAYFLVMEWVEGLDFRRYLQTYADLKQRAPWPLVVAVGIETARALSAAHERVDPSGRKVSVIHRDVTPQNILLGVNGLVKLTDFGLSRALDRAATTHPDIVKGKLAYLAPEVANLQPASPQSDIFSLGVVLWEAFAGRRLYEGVTDVEVLLKVRQVEIPPLYRFRTDLPRDLVLAVEQALATRPEDRFASARELLRALAKVLRGINQSTDSYAIASSVIEARCILGTPPPNLFAPPPGAAGPPKARTGKFPRPKTGRGLKPPPLPGSKSHPATKDLKPLSDEELAELLDEE